MSVAIGSPARPVTQVTDVEAAGPMPISYAFFFFFFKLGLQGHTGCSDWAPGKESIFLWLFPLYFLDEAIHSVTSRVPLHLHSAHPSSMAAY